MKKSKLSENLRALLEEKHFSEAQLAKELNIGTATINRIINSRDSQPNLGSLIPIAEYFNVTIDQLLGNKPLYNYDGKILYEKDTLALVPIFDLTYDNVHSIKNVKKNISPTDWGRWITININSKNSLVAFLLNEDDYQPSLQKNSLQVVELTQNYQSGDMLLIEFKNSQLMVFKKCFIEGDRIWLINLFKYELPNEAFNEEKHIIHGRVVLTQITYGNKNKEIL